MRQPLHFSLRQSYSSSAPLFMFFRTESTIKIITTPASSGSHGFCTNPAMIYVTKEITATVNAYGSCVDTWFT